MIQRQNFRRRKPSDRRDSEDRRFASEAVEFERREDGHRRLSDDRRGELDRRLFN